jgi:hypothetical protein
MAIEVLRKYQALLELFSHLFVPAAPQTLNAELIGKSGSNRFTNVRSEADVSHSPMSLV